jgi:hypothetical protein
MRKPVPTMRRQSDDGDDNVVVQKSSGGNANIPHRDGMTSHGFAVQ